MPQVEFNVHHELEFINTNKFKNLDECQVRIEQLLKRIQQHPIQNIRRSDFYYLIKIAKELHHIPQIVDAIQALIIESREPYFICQIAREIPTADIGKLQQAIVELRDLTFVAHFACSLPHHNQFLEDFILDSRDTRCAYLYCKYATNPNISRFRDLFVSSKKPRYLYLMAQHTVDPIELNQLQSMIINGRSHMYVRMFAANIPGADISKLAERILQTKNLSEIKKFAKAVQHDKINQILMLI